MKRLQAKAIVEFDALLPASSSADVDTLSGFREDNED